MMSNHATQEDLASLSSIGLLAYITSLPPDFKLYKTFLQKKFTRRTVDKAWIELVEKKYIAGVSMYVNRKKQYFYIASDEKLSQSEFDEFVEDTFFEVNVESGFIPKNLQLIDHCQFAMNFDFTTEIEKLSDARLVQHKEYSTKSAVPDVQIQRNTNKEISKRNTNKEISKDVNKAIPFSTIVEESFSKHGDGLFDAGDIEYFANKILDEMEAEPRNIELYVDEIVKTIVRRRKQKLGIPVETKVTFYNWLEERENMV